MRNKQGLPEEVVDILLEGNRRTTAAAYQSTRVVWRGWCFKWDKNPMSNDLTTIFDVLSHSVLLTLIDLRCR